MVRETRDGPAEWVLVVEDEPDIRDIVGMILEQNGIHALGAADGLEALALLRSGRPAPALIILDLMMPRMNGWQFREAQTHDPRLAGIPVLVLSGDGRVAEKASALGAAGFVRKPADVAELLRNVVRYLGGEGPSATPS
jgi:two-component system response regulator MprA